MNDRIEADYDVLEQLAAKFETRAAVIQQTTQTIMSGVDGLRNGGWIGRGSDAFYSEMQGDVLPAVQRLQQALEKAGQTTKQVNQIMKAAEEEACTPFRVRAV